MARRPTAFEHDFRDLHGDDVIETVRYRPARAPIFRPGQVSKVDGLLAVLALPPFLILAFLLLVALVAAIGVLGIVLAAMFHAALG